MYRQYKNEGIVYSSSTRIKIYQFQQYSLYVQNGIFKTNHLDNLFIFKDGKDVEGIIIILQGT